MSEVIRDCSIKLFGRTIGFITDKVEPEQRQSSSAATSVSSPDTTDKSSLAFRETKHGDNLMNTEETSTGTASSSSSSGIEFEKDSLSETKLNEEEPIERATLNKPDKIVPCPRCISKDTKFCYYNNNNQNQPRHFCKNCQRYWTNGGVMRNLPVGSGRRKTKSVPIPNHPHVAEPNGFVIFGSDGSILDESNTLEHSSRLGVPGVSIVFYPTTSYWGCALPRECAPPTCSTLGKRSREETIISPSNSGKENLMEKTSPNGSVLMPKTLRFDVPDEVAKSSIWSALGIKNDKIGSIKGTSLFKAFEGKAGRNSNIDSAAMVLQANPAALSRSLSFHESS